MLPALQDFQIVLSVLSRIESSEGKTSWEFGSGHQHQEVGRSPSDQTWHGASEESYTAYGLRIAGTRSVQVKRSMFCNHVNYHRRHGRMETRPLHIRWSTACHQFWIASVKGWAAWWLTCGTGDGVASLQYAEAGQKGEIAASKQALKSGLPGRVKACITFFDTETVYFVSLELCSSLPCLRYQVGWSFRSPRPRQQSQTSCASLAHLNGSNGMVSLTVKRTHSQHPDYCVII